MRTWYGSRINDTTYHGAAGRPLPTRAVRDEQLKAAITGSTGPTSGLPGAEGAAGVNREDIPVARCTVERLMGGLGLAGGATRQAPADHHSLFGVGPPGPT
jgi:putative transposase